MTVITAKASCLNITQLNLLSSSEKDPPIGRDKDTLKPSQDNNNTLEKPFENENLYDENNVQILRKEYSSDDEEESEFIEEESEFDEEESEFTVRFARRDRKRFERNNRNDESNTSKSEDFR